MKYPKELNNRTIGELLEGIAAAYEIKGKDRFRIRAYQNAAVSLKHYGGSLKQLWEEKKLKAIPGIGIGIADHLDELFRTGKVKSFEKAVKTIPEGFFELLKLPGIGPKTAYKLAKQFKLNQAETAIKDLKKKAEKGEISQLAGFALETERNILKTAKEFKKSAEERLLLADAQRLTGEIIRYLRQNKAFMEIKPLGSLRRQTATVGDIDLGVISSHSKACIDHFVRYPLVQKVLAQGENTARLLISDRVQVDLKVVKADVFGSLLQHFTGSKQHNILLREYALKRGFSLSEYGIKHLKGKNKGKSRTFTKEEEFYQFLSLDWIPPELREGTEEIEKARSHQLPKLVRVEEIRGDLHVHSNIDISTSHDLGRSSLKELVDEAQKLGYEYLGISDHNPKITNLSEKRAIEILKRRKKLIDEFNYSSENSVKQRVKKVFLLHSLEVDIKPDGSLSLPEKAFELFDYLIASIHSSFRQSKEKMTKRIIKALDNPKVKILGHPTGRMLGQRKPIEADWDKIFEACQNQKIFLEINAFPLRLDLPDSLVKNALKKGAKFAINSDSHATDQFNYMPFGLAIARRGWLEKKDVINTLPLNELKSIMAL